MAPRGCLTALALLAATGALAQPQPRRPAAPQVQIVAGGYELTSVDGARKCLMLLRPADTPGGQALGFPPACKLAFPLLVSVSAWLLEPVADPAQPRLSLRNAAGATLIEFSAAGADGSLTGRDAAGLSYHLKPTTGPSVADRLASARAAPTPPTSARFTPPPADPTAMRTVAGTYRLLRNQGRETGCSLTLATAATPEGQASLSPGCADRGVLIFAPTGWHMAGGTLWLTGSRGRLSFERNRKGGWDKAPGQGEALLMVPAAP